MLNSQLQEVRRLSDWASENARALKERGLNATVIARYFLDTSQADVPLLTQETVERYLATCHGIINNN